MGESKEGCGGAKGGKENFEGGEKKQQKRKDLMETCEKNIYEGATSKKRFAYTYMYMCIFIYLNIYMDIYTKF